MRGGGGGRRRPKESFTPRNPKAAAAPPAPFASRDSDASFCSSRPSTSSVAGTIPISDRSYQHSAIRTVNAYLSSHSLPFSLKSSLPSAKDILDTLRFLLTRLDFPSSRPEDDLHTILKHLNCPIKLNKSALRAPGTPHSWPSLLAVIHWLVQIAKYNDGLLDSSTEQVFFQDNALFSYAVESYLHYIRGDDEAVDALDHQLSGKLEQEKQAVVESLKGLEKEGEELQAKLEGLRSGPSPREVMEKERAVLEEDVKKFNAVIDQFSGKITALDKALEDKERELMAKEEERRKICDENEELKKRVGVQTVNLRDAERMKRELQAVDRDIEEAEAARSSWEEKSWDLDAKLRHELKELAELSIECNQAIRRLKLANGFQYVLNPKGSTPAEVLGIDYKSTLKPALDSFADDIKKSHMAKLEERISLQQQSAENAARMEATRNPVTALESYINEVEAQMNLLKEEMLEYTSLCEMEARTMIENVELEARNLDAVEREAAESLKTFKLKLQEVSRQIEGDILYIYKGLFALVDSVTKQKEYMATKISEMDNDFSEAASAISDDYRNSLQLALDIGFGTTH